MSFIDSGLNPPQIYIHSAVPITSAVAVLEVLAIKK